MSNAVLAAVGAHDKNLKANGQLVFAPSVSATQRGDDGASARRQDIRD